MAVRTFAIDGTSNSGADYRITASGLLVPASTLKARTGTLATPTLTGTGSFTCTVSPCTVAIAGTSNSLQASYLVTLDATANVTISAASASARTDLICLQVQDNNYDGSGFLQGRVLYVQGTSGGGVPATPANSIVLWQVPVGASAGSVNFASATAVYPFTAAAGAIVPVRVSSDKPAVLNGVQYRHRLDVAAGGNSPLEWSVDGVTYTPVANAAAMVKLGTATVATTGTVSSISVAVPAGYSSILGVWSARNEISTGQVIAVQLNGDTGANYGYEALEGANSTVTSSSNAGTNWAQVGRSAGNVDAAGAFGTGTFTIANASSTTLMKPIAGSGGNQQQGTGGSAGHAGTYTGTWDGTAAVTSVQLISPSTYYTAGTTLTLYGLT